MSARKVIAPVMQHPCGTCYCFSMSWGTVRGEHLSMEDPFSLHHDVERHWGDLLGQEGEPRPALEPGPLTCSWALEWVEEALSL